MRYLVEQRKLTKKGKIVTNIGSCFYTDSIEKVEKWLKENTDWGKRKKLWWWCIYSLTVDYEFGAEVYAFYDWDGNKLTDQEELFRKLKS